LGTTLFKLDGTIFSKLNRTKLISDIMKTLTLLTTAIASTFLTALPALSFSIIGATAGANSTTNNLITVSGISGSNAVSLSIVGSTGDLSGLSIYLQNPLGDKTLLLATNLGSGTFSSNVSFSDSINNLGNIDTNSSPYTGDFLPFDSLSDPNVDGGNNPIATINAFTDFSPNSDGNWNLKLINSASSSVSIGQTSLTFDTTPVPFEFSPTLGLGFLGSIYLISRILKNR
jgi:hypothetical protein